MTLQKNNFRYLDKSYWCGPAVLQMIFLESGIDISQKTIAKHVYDPKWGSSHEDLYKFAKQFFTNVQIHAHTDIKKLEQILQEGYLVILNIQSHSYGETGGHYVCVSEMNTKEKTLVLFNPDTDAGITTITYEELSRDWYDYATEHDEKHAIKTEGWALAIHPDSKKSPVPSFKSTQR